MHSGNLMILAKEQHAYNDYEEKADGAEDVYSDGSDIEQGNNNTNTNGKRKVGKPRKDVTKADIAMFLHLPQQEAAARLQVSVSTLKRRYQEYFNTKARWPSPAQRKLIAAGKKVQDNVHKTRLKHVLILKPKSAHVELLDEKLIEDRAMQLLMQAFHNYRDYSFNAKPNNSMAANTAFGGAFRPIIKH